jgi:glycerol-3-phosphate O-acyltransferase
VVRAFALFLTWVWNRVYNGVEVHNFERVTTVAPDHGIIYVPCHRSHVDYLLLSYIIFTRGLMVPHIAAGANLNLPVVGSILRRSGAFFLRRKIKGDPLYTAVFLEYLHMMVDRGFPIEYFIEGGRSRSGRMLAPKAGILAMTVQSFVRSRATAAGLRPGVHRLREADGGQEPSRRAQRPAQEVGVPDRPDRRRAPAAAELRQGACQFRNAGAAGGIS